MKKKYKSKKHELTVSKYYSKALVELQLLIPISSRPIKLKKELRKKRALYYRHKIWDEAICRVVSYTKLHKNNFRDGRLYAN